jgi:hypothetical protein
MTKGNKKYSLPKRKQGNPKDKKVALVKAFVKGHPKNLVPAAIRNYGDFGVEEIVEGEYHSERVLSEEATQDQVVKMPDEKVQPPRPDVPNKIAR